MGHCKSSPKRNIHSSTDLSSKTNKQKQEKAQINNLTSHFKELKKQQQMNKAQMSRKKEILKIRAEIHEIQSKKNSTKDQ